MTEQDKPITQSTTKHAGGRPSDYTEELSDVICAYISEGMSIRKIEKLDGMPSMVTIFAWLRAHPEFLKQYTRAKSEQADANQERIQELVDDVISGIVDPQAARVAGDLLKWSSAKLLPKKYGDKLDMTTNGKDLPTPILGGLTNQNTNDDINDRQTAS